MTREERKQIVLDSINDFDTDFEQDHSEVTSAVETLAGLKGYYPDLDKEYIKRAKQFGEYLEDDDVYGEGWPHWAPEIANGEYPLKKLPDHIRDLAEELYYKEKANVARKT